MAVFHIVGRLGSGKTLWSVTKMINDLLFTDKHIYTNILLRDFWDKKLVDFFCTGLRQVYKYLRSPFPDLPQYKRHLASRYINRYHYFNDINECINECFALGEAPESSRLMYWDEIHLDLNSREWKSTSKDTIKFFSMSRKLGFDIYIISQLKGAVDRQMRDLADVSYEIKNLKFLQPFGLKIFPAVGVLTKRWSNQGGDSAKTVSMGFGFVKYSDEYGQFYNTGQIVANKEFTQKDIKLWVCVPEHSGFCGHCKHIGFQMKYGRFVSRYYPRNDEEIASFKGEGVCHE
jgi:hypothetical protein